MVDPPDVTRPYSSDIADSRGEIHGFELTIVEGPEAGRTWRSDDTDRCAIGTASSNDLVLRDHTVSRWHCEIAIEGQARARIRDLDSTNRVILNHDVPITDAFLKRGALIRLGQTVLRFQFAGQRKRALSSRTQFGDLVGQSVAMRAVFSILERAAATDTTVLLQGETGTGKSAVARSLHKESARKDGPFVMLDCSSLPEALIESELFGHERGAFTGANARRVGAFEEASGGTIFLDEIGELPRALQPKLLTVLEERVIRRLGGNDTRPVDVRVIAATNRDLRREVNKGRFREDLYYRIRVISAVMPPLRERPADIALLVPTLVSSLLGTLRMSREQADELLTEDFMRSLGAASWPGNVRQLRNYLENYLAMRGEPDLVEGHPDAPQPGDASEPPTRDPASVPVDVSIGFKAAKARAVREFERRYIKQVVSLHNGNITRAARAAGIDRTYFYRKMNLYKIRE